MATFIHISNQLNHPISLPFQSFSSLPQRITTASGASSGK
nr:MAG TPA: hypothetical protein [Caudoviricetes sp.]